MKILLVYPQIKIHQAYSYGIGYVSAVLKEHGHSVECAVLKDVNDAGFYAKLKENDPQIIGFLLLSCQAGHLAAIIAGIKQFSSAFIVCGGIHPSVKPDHTIQIPGVDAIVRGEGEHALLELANALEKKENYLHIKNFWFRQGNEIIKNELRSPTDLDALPFPDKSIFDYQLLLDQTSRMNRFIFGRGCPYNCPYCSCKVLRDIYIAKEAEFCSRMLNPKKCIEMIRRDADKYKFDTIIFDDDIICINKKWFYEFFNLYKEEFKYPFYCNVRVGTIDADMVRLLKEAGVKGIFMGIEHGNEAFRKAVLKRNISNKQLIDTVKLFDSHHIEDSHGHVMIGLPNETMELFLDTVRLCRQLNIKYFSYIFSPYPGTEFGDICEQNHWIPVRADYSERMEATIDFPKFSRKEIQLCYGLFNYLVRYKFLPLRIPFLPTGSLLGIYDRLFIIFRRMRSALTLSFQPG